MPAHARGKLKSWVSLRMLTPSAFVGPPKYSPTLAQIIESTAATFRPVNMNGSEFGIRTWRKTETSPAAYERMSSIDRGFTDVRPRKVLTITGKKQSTAAIAIFETWFSRPNQLLVIGAKAMIGTAFAAIAKGISAAPTPRKRASRSAARTPRPEPIAKPPAASLKV